MATMFKVLNGVEMVKTPKEVQKLLKENGITATMKDILAGKVAEVEVVTVDDTGAPIDEDGNALDDSAPAPTPEDTEDGFMQEEPEHVVAARKLAQEQEAQVAKALQEKGVAVTPATDEVEYPERGSLADEKAMKKVYKKLSDTQVFEWCELEGVTWKRCPEQPPIDRMRAIMALKDAYFPKAKTTTSKSKSKYADLTTEQLVEMANEAGVTVKDAKGNDKILRMYTIMALRDAGYLEA